MNGNYTDDNKIYDIYYTLKFQMFSNEQRFNIHENREKYLVVIIHQKKIILSQSISRSISRDKDF